MLEFLYRIQPTRPAMLAERLTEHESAVMGEHFAYLEKLTAEGVVLLAGPTLNRDERAFGIVILTIGSEAEARDIMLNDPAVKQGVMHAELFPYRVSLWSTKR